MKRIMENAQRFQRLAALAAALCLAGCACRDRPTLPTKLPGEGAVVPIDGMLRLDPASLPAGASASYPAFNGDSFSAVLPVLPQDELSAAQALEAIEPVLRAVGFERSLAELRVPEEPVRLPPADLKAMAEVVCQEAALRRNGKAEEVCAALRGDGPPSPAAVAALRDAYGATLAQLKDDVERPVLQYPFAQLVGGVPIDGAGAFASRSAGESLSTVHGTLFNEYRVANEPGIGLRYLLDAARVALRRAVGSDRPPDLDLDGAVLVLIPYGGEAGVPILRHAWRTLVKIPNDRRSWMVWLDAGTGRPLKLVPQWDHGQVQVQGERWRRDPGLSPPTEVATFEVDQGAGGKHKLELQGVFERFDLKGNGSFAEGELEATAADFKVGPLADEASAVCGNAGFRQVHAYSHLFSSWKAITSAGSILDFPEKPIRVWIDFPDDGEGSMAHYDESLLLFVDGAGFMNKDECPRGPKGTRLNGVQDTTTLVHEMSHLSVKRLQDRRPDKWCKGPSCQLPVACGRELFHDFADALGLAYASTPCFSGWTHKNVDGEDKNLYCQGWTSEAGELPRLIELPEDHFPEHQALGTGPYAEGQVAAAGLLAVRKGLRSKDPASGTALFSVRLQRALWDYAFLHPTCTTNCKASAGGCDRDVYRYLQDLEGKMLAQWVVAGDGTANKVLAGWADAGVFLVPYKCLDEASSTMDSNFCGKGDSGGDAVIDADDRDTGLDDDIEVDGVVHPEVDYLERNGPVPGFRVWTGPRFLFDAAGNAKVAGMGQALCHTDYRIEVSDDPMFPVSSTSSAQGKASQCYAEPNFPNWVTLKGPPNTKRVFYYRVITWTPGSPSAPRDSLIPVPNGPKLPPPFVVINDSGKP